MVSRVNGDKKAKVKRVAKLKVSLWRKANKWKIDGRDHGGNENSIFFKHWDKLKHVWMLLEVA